MRENKTIIEDHILKIIQKNEIREQVILQNMLKKLGYDVAQATLSRYLQKLKIAKVSGIYKVIDFHALISPVVLNMQVSTFGLIVLHTHPGNANSLGYFIDQKYVTYDNASENQSGILGTIAGDDTVLIIIKSKNDLKKVISLLKKEFPNLNNIGST